MSYQDLLNAKLTEFEKRRARRRPRPYRYQPYLGRYKKAHYTAKRRAAQKQAIPSWADMDAIRAFYDACPPEHHVDHIIPLQHPLVCGLHTIDNFQYLHESLNSSKNNFFEI